MKFRASLTDRALHELERGELFVVADSKRRIGFSFSMPPSSTTSLTSSTSHQKTPKPTKPKPKTKTKTNRLAPRSGEAGSAPLRLALRGAGLPDPGTARGRGDAGRGPLGQRERKVFLVLFFISFLSAPPLPASEAPPPLDSTSERLHRTSESRKKHSKNNSGIK